MNQEAIVQETARKKKIGELGLLFVSVVVALTFFSGTINNFTLARVETARPTNGALVKEIFGEGTVEAKATYEEYTDTSLRVKEVMVGLGDRVTKGQPLISLDVDTLKSDHQDEQARYQQLEISLAGARADQKQKQRNYDITKTFFDNGGESAVNVQNAEKSLADAERNCQNIRLNLETQAREMENLAKQLESGGVYTAPVNGIIIELNFAKGSMTNNSLPLYKLADPRQGFRLIVPVANDLADYARPGDTVNVNILSLEDKKAEGKIDKIVADSRHPGEEKDLWVGLSVDGVAGGEKGEIYLSKKTKQYPTLIPNSAVYSDSGGSYIYILKFKKGPLGTENYIQKMSVNVEDYDNQKCALSEMVMDEVVVQSDKPLEDGDKVLKGASS